MVQQPPPLPSSDFLFCRHSCTKHFCQGNARETVSALGFAPASSHPPSSFYFSRSRSCRSSSSQRAFYARTRPRSARHVAWQRLPVCALLDQPLFVIAGAHYSVLPALILSVLAGGEAARMQRNMRAAIGHAPTPTASFGRRPRCLSSCRTTGCVSPCSCHRCAPRRRPSSTVASLGSTEPLSAARSANVANVATAQIM